MRKLVNILLILLLLLTCSSAANAQRKKDPRAKRVSRSASARARKAAPVLTAEQKKEQEANKKTKWGLTQKELDKFFLGSFLFSGAEAALIQKAMMGRVEMPQQTQETLSLEKKEIPKRRVIQISGVFFRTVKDWTVWINGKKVTPYKQLPEIIDIEVRSSSYLHLKWYDVGLNKVISITMRPNQVYDITTGILLPG